MTARRPELLLGAGLFAAVGATWLLRYLVSDASPGMATWDLEFYFLPSYEAIYGWIRQGRLPLWNPYLLTGIPWLGTVSVAALYPGHVLYLLLPVNLGLAASHALHLIWIGVSTAWLGRRVGLCHAAAAVAGLGFALHGAATSFQLYPAQLESMAWLPLGCIGVWDIVHGTRRRGVALLATSSGLSLLGGSPQIFVYVHYAWGTLWLVLLVAQRPPLRRLPAEALAFAAAIGIGAALAAVQLLPAAELAREATRTMETLTRQQVRLTGLPGFWELETLLEGSLGSLGALPLVLAPAALFARRQRALVGWALGVGALAYLGASAANETIVDAHRALPVIGWFRYPMRLVLLTHFALALLAGAGVQALLEGASASPRRRRAVAAATLGALAVGGIAASQGQWARLTIAALGAVPIALCAIPSPGRLRGAAAALVALAIADLWIDGPAAARMPYGRPDSIYTRNAAFFSWAAERTDPGRLVWITPHPRRELKLAPRYGLRVLQDYEPSALRRHAEYFTAFLTGKPQRDDGRYFTGDTIGLHGGLEARGRWQRRRLLDLAAVRLFGVRTGSALPGTLKGVLGDAPALAPDADSRLQAYENPTALPRAFVSYRALAAPPPAELLRRLARPDFDPRVASYVEGEPPFAAADDAPPRGGVARIVVDEPERVEIEAELAAPGLIVLADTFYPGWGATVDGREAPILATNHLYRGVAAPAGRHRVVFAYRPRSVRAGAAASVLALLVLIALVRPRPDPSTREG